MTLIRAHFDGQAIVLDEPADLQPNQQLLVQVIQAPGEVGEPEFSWKDLRGAALTDEPGRGLNPNPRLTSGKLPTLLSNHVEQSAQPSDKQPTDWFKFIGKGLSQEPGGGVNPSPRFKSNDDLWA